MMMVANCLRAAADAWEAQVKKAEERAFTHQVIDATLELRDENKSLRTRLAEAEWLLRHAPPSAVLSAGESVEWVERYFRFQDAALAHDKEET